MTIGVAQQWRGLGVGTGLLRALIAQAGGTGPEQLSLSVEPDNAARRLYERLGFLTVATVGRSLTMLLRL